MIPVFSFKKSVVHNMLECAGILYPGIKKAVGVCYEMTADKVCFYEYDAELEKVVEIAENKYQIDTSKERKNSKNYQWKNSSELQGERKIQQLGIYDDEINNLLLLRVENEYDKLNDLLYLFINNQMPVFQMEHNPNGLSEREKTLLARSIVNNIRFLKIQLQQDKEIFRQYNNSVMQTRQQISESEMQLRSARENYAASISAFCTQEIAKIANENDLQIHLSRKALETLSEYKGGFSDLPNILQRSVMMAMNLKLTDSNDVLTIEKQDILFEIQTTTPSEEKKQTYISDRYSRTRDLLNRYEKAAILAKENGFNVTGKNIGTFCQPSISAGAIGDAISNHEKKIVTLFNEAPDLWPVIRNEFRSMINLEQKSRERATSMR